MKYCLDTSALLQAWVRAYPIDRFPSLWTRFESGFASGELGYSEEVRREIARKEDGLSRWLTDRSTGFESVVEIQKLVLTVLEKFPRLLNTKKGKSGADAFVIATAMHCGATVVTEEGSGADGNPRIPHVCDALRVPYANTLGLIRGMNLVF